MTSRTPKSDDYKVQRRYFQGRFAYSGSDGTRERPWRSGTPKKTLGGDSSERSFGTLTWRKLTSAPGFAIAFGVGYLTEHREESKVEGARAREEERHRWPLPGGGKNAFFRRTRPPAEMTATDFLDANIRFGSKFLIKKLEHVAVS